MGVSSLVIFRATLPRFEYFRPKTLSEALELLNRYSNEAAVLAGGTDLLVDMRVGIKRPKYLIDIKGIKELHIFNYEEGKGLTIGATVTLNEILENNIVKDKYFVLWDAIRQMCDAHLRNRATLVGNICNASPAADSAPPLLIYHAEVELASKDGMRRVPLKEFFVGVKKTIRKPNELVTKIYIPEPPEGSKSRYLKIGRTHEDLAIVGIAGLVANIEEPSKRIVRLAYASVAPTPIIIDEVEDVFKGEGPLDALIDKAIDVVMKKVSPITDVRATREYRLHLIKYLTKYLLKLLFTR